MYQEDYQQDINELKSELKENQQQFKAQLKELKKIKRENFYELFGAQIDKAAELWVLLCLQKKLMNQQLSEQEFRELVNQQITDKVHQQSDIIRNKNKSNKKMSKTEMVKKETRLRQEVLYLQKLAKDKKLFDDTLLALNRKGCFGLIFSQFSYVWVIFDKEKRDIYKTANQAQDLVNKKVKEISSKYEEEAYKIENEFNNKISQKKNAIYSERSDLVITEEDGFGVGAMLKNMQIQQILQQDNEYNQLLQEKNNKQNQIELEKQSALSNNSELLALKKQADIEYQKASRQEEELKIKQQKKIGKLGKIENIINKVNATVREVQDITKKLSNRQQEAKMQKQNTNNMQPIQEADGQDEIDEEEKQPQVSQTIKKTLTNKAAKSNGLKYMPRISGEESYINHIAHIGGYKVDRKIVNNAHTNKNEYQYDLFQRG